MIMQNIWSREIDFILNNGVLLKNNGVHNWALSREAALIALEQLSAMSVAVLGGDVYLMTAEGLKVSYDNWYCNRETAESEKNYVMRSIATAVRYIKNYQEPSNNAFFAIIPEV